MQNHPIILLTTLLVLSSPLKGLTQLKLNFADPDLIPIQIAIPIEVQNIEVFRENFEVRYIVSGSMSPTLEVNDKILIDKHTYRNALPQRGDLVIFNPPETLQKQNFRDPLVHRLIGLPGETLEIKEGQVIINGRVLKEDYISEPPSYQYGTVQIPENSYFVLGDNRDNAYDSHYWGFVSRELIYGKVIGIYCPVERQRILDSEPLNAKNQEVLNYILNIFKNQPSFCSMQPEQQESNLLIYQIMHSIASVF